jgi:lantibiotic modifying enzyme
MCSKPNSTEYQKIVKERFVADKGRPTEAFGPLGQLEQIEGPLSDLHEDFSAVHILHFSSGCKIVYKPRRLRVDLIYSRLCHDLFEMPSTTIVESDQYGWMQFFDSEAADPDTHFRVGQQLALLMALRSSDHHSDNLILSGGFPRFVDMECTLAPEMSYARRASTDFAPAATRIFQDPKLNYNLPELNRGLRAGQEKIQVHRDQINQAMESLADEPMRVLLRGTPYYMELIRHTQEYELGMDDVYEILISEAAQFPDVARFEAKCVSEGRIPRFTYLPLSCTVEAEGQRFEGLIDLPGLPLARDAILS